MRLKSNNRIGLFSQIATFVTVALLAMECTAGEKSGYYVINNAKKTIYGTDISADKDGNLSLELPGGGSQRFKKGTYIGAHCPKPKQLVTAEGLARKNDVSQAITMLNAVSSPIVFWDGQEGSHS